MSAANVKTLLCDATKRLRAAGVESPARDARLLLAEAMGVEHPALLAPAGHVGVTISARFADTVARREAREPVARIRGRREFWGLDFALTAATLDPRPDTETVVAAALSAFAGGAPPARILDLGTGSGCLLCALLHEFPQAHGVGIDRSAEAVGAAQSNAVRLGFGGRAGFVVGDWGEAIAGRFDLIVANPPYVASAAIAALAPEVAVFDPRLGLDGGADGLAAYCRVASALARLLAPSGAAVLEVGQGQGHAIAALLRAAGVDPERSLADLSGVERAVIARVHPRTPPSA